MKNTGVHKGKEVVQLYVNKLAGEFDQPYQQLAAFAKTKELAPSENSGVTLTFRFMYFMQTKSKLRKLFIPKSQKKSKQ